MEVREDRMTPHAEEGTDGATTDARARSADEREAELDAREARAEEQSVARAARLEQNRIILAAADARDHEADARDVRADKRDTDADREAFLSSAPYGSNMPARRSAAIDRSDSRTDRTSAAADRDALADLPATAEREGDA